MINFGSYRNKSMMEYCEKLYYHVFSMNVIEVSQPQEVYQSRLERPFEIFIKIECLRCGLFVTIVAATNPKPPFSILVILAPVY